MATLLTTRPVVIPACPETPPASPDSPHLFLSSSTPIPNKHRVFPNGAPDGPLPTGSLPSPPASPLTSSNEAASSPLHPPDCYAKLNHDPPVFGLSASELADALDHVSTQPLPDASKVFPWLHGISPRNQMQMSFFKSALKDSFPTTPRCLRALTIVKAGSDLSFAKLKGAVAPEELLMPLPQCESQDTANETGGPRFINLEPSQGFSVRNFKIQCCKLATCSDIVVYGDDQTPRSDIEALASVISQAQGILQGRTDSDGQSGQPFHTFVLRDSFAAVERDHPRMIAWSNEGKLTQQIIDFSHQERKEMADMTEVSEIAKNVFLGPAPQVEAYQDPEGSGRELFHIWIEASDYAQVPEPEALEQVEEFLIQHEHDRSAIAPLEFPSSGSFGARCSIKDDIEAVIDVCHWIYKMANGQCTIEPTEDMDVDDQVEAVKTRTLPPRRVMIFCSDGYTESSLLALAYYMYANCVPASEAFIQLHQDKRRNFFAYPADKFFLEYAQRQIMYQSPMLLEKTPMPSAPPMWMKRMDGSLPSRVLDYMYLGNLNHATNPGVLRRLGITHVLSVGEPISWGQDPAILHEDKADWPSERFMFVDKVQDNGVDPLTKDFDRCLEFIGKAKASGGAVLVHCHRGVSRSATICIAEVMKSKAYSFPRAYCFVRARRLNVIIQPHLLFAYELLKWEEHLCQQRGVPLRRECEWATVAREIAILNKPYCKE